jgi:hypothetical protein
MVRRSEVPGAIEGKKILVCGRKIVPKGRPISIPNSDELAYPVDVEMQGTASILEEKYPPKTSLFKDYSLLDMNDEISGTNLWGFSSDPIVGRNFKVGGRARTSTHPNQELELNGICFMELIMGWRGTAIPRHPREVLIS